MKLLIVTPYFAPAWGYGGPPKFLTEFAQSMVKLGHSVSVVTTDALDHRHNPKLREIIAGVKVYRLKNLSNSLAWHQKLFIPTGAREILDLLVPQADFVFLSDFRHLLNAACYLACQNHAVPYGLAVFGSLPITNDWKAPVKRFFDRWYGRRILRDARVLFAQNDHEAKAYEKITGPNKAVKIWPLAIDLKQFEVLSKKRPNHKKTILFVGRFNRYKGIDQLVRSLAKLKKRLAVQLVLVGRDDGELDNLKKIIKQHHLQSDVILPGPLYNQDVITTMVNADIFVITPTHAEETPLAGLMALATCCPVIVNRNAQIPWLDQAGAGVTLKRDDQLTSTLLNLLTNDKLLKRMGQAARRLAFKRFDWQIRVKEFERYVKSN